MRLADEQNLFRRAGLDELRQHLARQVAWVADLAPQLAVAEGASAAFAELHIRFWVEHALAPQAPGVLGAFAHLATAFQHDRAQAQLRKHQRRKQAEGAKADDQRSRPLCGVEVSRRMADKAVTRVGARAHAGRQHNAQKLLTR